MKIQNLSNVCCLTIAVSTLIYSHVYAGPESNRSQEASLEVRELVNELGNRDVSVRTQAFKTLSEVATTKDLKFLENTLTTHQGSRTRVSVARVIGRIGQVESVTSLTKALKNDESLWVRRAAVYALGAIGDTGCRPALVDAMNNDLETSVRKRAATVLMQFGGSYSVRAVRKARETEKDNSVRLAFDWALGNYKNRNRATRLARLLPGKKTSGRVNGTEYLVYTPSKYKRGKTMPLLVSVHGTDGLAQPYLDMCVEDAEKYGMIIIAPRFDYPTFPNYGFANVDFDEVRADLRLLEIIDQTLKKTKVSSDRFLLFGHSQGGQFVQRFVLAHPDRIMRAAACGSGNYVHAGADMMFPNGAKPNPFAPDLDTLSFEKFVTTPLAIVLGTNELQRRIEEADRFMTEVALFAKQNSLNCRIRRFNVQGGKHSGASNYPTAIKFLCATLVPSNGR